jgi:hypothetical protein
MDDVDIYKQMIVLELTWQVMCITLQKDKKTIKTRKYLAETLLEEVTRIWAEPLNILKGVLYDAQKRVLDVDPND